MPAWSSQLPSSTSPHGTYAAASNSTRTPETQLNLTEEDYFGLERPPRLQDPANPFAGSSRSPSSKGSPAHGKSHGRSFSDKLPPVFRSGSRSRTNPDAEVEAKSVPTGSYIHSHAQLATMAKAARQTQTHDEESEVGRCATCDQKAKWPKGRSEYRCGNCSMINDLVTPSQARQVGDTTWRPGHRSDTVSSGHSSDSLQLTIERTSSIIDQCMRSFLETRFSTRSASQTLVTGPYPATVEDPRQNFSRPFGTGPPLKSSPHSLKPSGSTRTGSGSRPLHFQAQRKGSTAASEGRPGPHEPSLLSSKLPQSSIESGKHINILRKPVPGPAITTVPSRPVRDAPLPPRTDYESGPVTQSPTEYSSGAQVNMLEVPNLRTYSSPERGRERQQRASDSRLADRSIFRPLEDYMSKCFGQFDSLNKAFLRHSRNDRGPKRSMDKAKTIHAEIPSRKNVSAEAELSTIDAKTLLIGDIAENGLWWTGKSEEGVAEKRRQPGREHDQISHSTSLVSHRSPHIMWDEVSKWYDLTLGVGCEWRARLQRFREEDEAHWQASLSDDEAAACDAALAEARFHVHKVMMRLCDSLLKRPGRPLRKASDLRFLLIILANPMLRSRRRDQEQAGSCCDSWDQSYIFTILKRILGLLSNCNAECQRHLATWFSRYDETLFRSVVELLESFVTYRIRRQRSHKSSRSQNLTGGLVPNLSGTSADASASAELHAALGLGGKSKVQREEVDEYPAYRDDWQVKAAARVMALLFAANKSFHGERRNRAEGAASRTDTLSRQHLRKHGQLLSTSDFYNTAVDYCDVIEDFDSWENAPGKFAFCQYPFFLSVRSKIRIMEHDARRQMEIKAREAFFKSLLRNAAVEQHVLLRVRRECLVEDSLKTISEAVAQGQEEIKKGIKVQFANEEGVDAGGLRKEWFLLLVREIFDPHHAMFIYDDDSRLCYFNPHSFETSDQYFLVGALLGLAIYNSTILDVPLPPFTFKKLLLSGPSASSGAKRNEFTKGRLQYTLEDLGEWRPQLAKGLRDLMEFEGNVQDTFCRDFVVAVERYGQVEQVELCAGGSTRAVTNENREEFVELYVRYMLDTQVTRQFEPFKRGFFTVCGGNALSLFQPEEIELVIRGSEERLDVPSLKAVAVSEHWPDDATAVIEWFWEAFGAASPSMQRKLLGFITGSDRIPAVGATSLTIKLAYGGGDSRRLPIARTCFNQITLPGYADQGELEAKLWQAVEGSQGFGLV